MEDLPLFLERLARVQSDSMQPLADVLAEAQAESLRSATIVAITPDWPSPRLAEVLRGGDAQGGASFVFALDAESFRAGRPGLPDSLAGPNVLRVRRGDDLTALLEGTGLEGTGLEGTHHG